MGEELSLWERGTAASAGAVLTAVFMTPLDVAKVRLQAQTKAAKRPRQCFVYSNGLMDHICTFCQPHQPSASASTSKSALSCEWYGRPPQPSPFKGTLDALVKIQRYEGLRSLWAGLSPTLVIAMPATVGYFTLNDHLCLRWKRSFGDKLWVPALAGSVARSAVVLLTNPAEIIRTKLQSENLSYRDIGRAFRTSKAAEGWRVFWKGLAPTLARDVTFTAIYWGLLDLLKTRQMKAEGRTEPNFRISFLSGAASALIAALATNPMDVIKTRRQIELGERGFRNGGWGANYAIASELVRNEGWTWLRAGLVPRLAKVIPACAIMIATYDAAKAFFQRRRRRQ